MPEEGIRKAIPCSCDLEVGFICERHHFPWYRIEVSDRQGQIIAIETDQLCGREIGDAERETVVNAIRDLQGFIGDNYHQRMLDAHRRYHDKVGCPGRPGCYVCEEEDSDAT